MISFINDEQKREFIKAFNDYVGLEKQKKRLSQDTSVVFKDFFNQTFTDLDSHSKKEKKKEYNLCTRTKCESKTGKEVLEIIEQKRMEHLELSDSEKEYYEQIVDDKLDAKVQAENLSKQQKELFTVMRKYIVETEEVAKAVVAELVKEALGKVGMLDRVSAGVAEGKALLFNVEAVEVE